MFRTAVYGVCEEEMAYREPYSTTLWDFMVPFIRFWGILTAVVVSGVGVDIALHNHSIGHLYIIFAGIVFFLEITWIITLFIQVCSKTEYDCCSDCWGKVLWFRTWKKSLLYLIFGLVLLFQPHRLWLSIAAGLQLLLLSGLYLMLAYRTWQQGQLIPSPRLLHSQTPSQDENYDDMTGVLDDSLPDTMLRDNLAELDHDTILEM